ncbi:MBL fold metallo-hydrolase [Rubrivirga sp. S365]|uniref:MBL fold metallo-hydrolase n=1 Tax=Rubrivirga litoralis TaxID=3075598 RepID=A0ABU3BQT6_9BACT|nr:MULTISPECIES: MBL fold metallo-hydrolase [unclassified Rubrivirga]MDT0631654.1 MBL fold metallo-hydrolase [Rubrivirga sp. F394]MDT7855603.1 MBL fold metallo-hydrolase [Rubrivirga sp. S365]
MPDRLLPVADSLVSLRTGIVNVLFVGPPGAGDRGWVLVDTGLPGSADAIREAAARRFGASARPSGIVLTHGHFDHVGAVEALAEAWDAPVYAHPLELPYLTGRSAYPPPDPTVGGGALAALSFLYPKRPIDLGDRARALPEGGAVPDMPGWRWIWTPGHAPGHVSLWREADRTLVAGDAFVTTKQESLISVALQRPTVQGPPAYFTPDWTAARHSVRELAALEPEAAGTGHGPPLRGAELRRGLARLAAEFERRAVPAHGRYVGSPAVTDAGGVVSVPPPDPRERIAVGVVAASAGSVALRALARRALRR